MCLQKEWPIFPALSPPSHRAAGGFRQDLVINKPDLAHRFQFFLFMGVDVSVSVPALVAFRNICKKARLDGLSCLLIHRLQAVGKPTAVQVKIL